MLARCTHNKNRLSHFFLFFLPYYLEHVDLFCNFVPTVETNSPHNPSPHSLSPTLPRREGDETPEKRSNLKTQPSKFNPQNSTLKIQPSKFNLQNSTFPKPPFTQILLVQILKITTIKTQQINCGYYIPLAPTLLTVPHPCRGGDRGGVGD